ncbi:MAG: tetratricopeptide repeat protein [Treponemataceae bacterium]
MKKINKFGFTVFAFFILLTSLTFAQSKKTAVDYYNEGKFFQQKGDFLEASVQYQEALFLNPNYADCWFNLAQCAYEISEYSRALTCLEQAEKFTGGNIEVKRLKGFCLIGKGELNDAQKIFEQIISDFPNDIESMFGLAQLKIFEGSFSLAEKYYLEALTRQSNNKKALLSLSLVSLKLGKIKEAENFIKQAITYHSEEEQVYYFASYIELVKGNLVSAERYANTALRINKNYDQAASALSYILFSQGKYEKAKEICDFRIAKNRNLPDAWYLKAVCCYNLGAIEACIKALEKTLIINPQDEIARCALEAVVCENLPIEDKRRSAYAEYHVKSAKESVEKYDSGISLLEYIRALQLDPLNLSVRLSYADWLLNEGYAEYSLEQLKFIQNQGDSSRSISDRIESYDALLCETLGKKWNVNPLYIDKSRVSICFYYFDGAVTILHADSTKFCTMLLADTFDAFPYFNVKAAENSVKTYSQAYKDAKNAGYDYFGIVKYEETERENVLKVDLYCVKTGVVADSWVCYRTGNKKLRSCIQKISNSIAQSFSQRGKIIDRKSNNVLIDLGKRDGISVEDEFLVVKKGNVKIAESGIGLEINPETELGTVKLTFVGEDLSQGTFKQLGYYDQMNISDEVIVINKEDSEEKHKNFNPNDLTSKFSISEFSNLLNSIR